MGSRGADRPQPAHRRVPPGGCVDAARLAACLGHPASAPQGLRDAPAILAPTWTDANRRLDQLDAQMDTFGPHDAET